jgi:dipeptidyl aminopeptidase/acylaminoacyl peptidase
MIRSFFLTAIFLYLSLLSLADEPPQRDSTDLPIPFERWTTKDTLGRTITFYISRLGKEEKEKKLPVVLFVQGSGCQSLFQKRGERITGGLQNLLLAEAKGKVRVLVVEKPGVKFLDQPKRPGGAEGASEEFLKEHTLPRWAEANMAAVKAAWTLPGVDASRTLVMGHSEGGIVAARVAAELPTVTHVASLSGGGPTQLFDLVEARSKPRPGEDTAATAKRRDAVYEEWRKIQADPESTTKFWLGHPYRRWSSFLKHSVAEEVLRSKAKIYLAQGTEDTSVMVAAHDVVVAELRARGRDVTAERVEGADHGFRLKNAAQGGPPKEMQEMFGRILAWFLT